jgi:hypothetical protein
MTPLMMLLTTPVGTLIEPSVGRAMVVGRTSLTMLLTTVGIDPSRMLLAAVGMDPSRTLLITPVGMDPSRTLLIAPVGRSVGRTSLTMLDSEMSLTMLETVSGSPVTEGRSDATPPTMLVTSLGMSVKGRSVGPGKSVIGEMVILDPRISVTVTGTLTGTERLVGPGRSVKSEITSLMMLEAREGVRVGTEMSLTSETITLAILETGRLVGPGRSVIPEKTSLMTLVIGRPGRIGAGADVEPSAELWMAEDEACDAPAEALTLAETDAEALTLAETEAEIPLEVADEIWELTLDTAEEAWETAEEARELTTD